MSILCSNTSLASRQVSTNGLFLYTHCVADPGIVIYCFVDHTECACEITVFIGLIPIDKTILKAGIQHAFIYFRYAPDAPVIDKDILVLFILILKVYGIYTIVSDRIEIPVFPLVSKLVF